jgi:uncharacterized protein YndB with AHSA1/START domain
MPASAKTDRVAGVSDVAVQAKTGKTWQEWFAILDAAGARRMAHRDIAILLREKHQVPDWWTQMVTVGYEQARQGRQKHQVGGSFNISRSKTVDAPLKSLYRAWQDRTQRERWLPRRKVEIRKATPDKSMRITWSYKKTNLEVNFYAKGRGKSQVVVQHSQLPSTAQADKMKTFWGEALKRLKASLEGKTR